MLFCVPLFFFSFPQREIRDSKRLVQGEVDRQRQGTKQADASGSGVSGVSDRIGGVGGAGGDRPALPNVMGLTTSDLGGTGTGVVAGKGERQTRAWAPGDGGEHPGADEVGL